MIRFVLGGLPRSGTTVVAGALADHPAICCYGELLNDVAAVRSNEAARVTLGAGWRVAACADPTLAPCGPDEDGANYLERFFALTPRARALGFKLQFDQALSGPNRSAWRYLASDEKLHIIHVRRDNLLEVVCSYARARITRRWHNPDAPVAPIRFVLPPHECEPLFERFEQAAARGLTLARAHPVHEVDYAAIAADFAGTMAGIFEFLGVESREPAAPRLHKIAAVSPAVEIVNYAALKAHFLGTRFARHFAF